MGGEGKWVRVAAVTQDHARKKLHEKAELDGLVVKEDTMVIRYSAADRAIVGTAWADPK